MVFIQKQRELTIGSDVLFDMRGQFGHKHIHDLSEMKEFILCLHLEQPWPRGEGVCAL